VNWASNWWQHDVVDGHKGPLLLSFVAFVLPFLLTRTVTRLIRAGRGPFRNLSEGGVHLHHSTPGCSCWSPVVSLRPERTGAPVAYIAAAFVGVGASLVLDGSR
jgi:hypothetical protein